VPIKVAEPKMCRKNIGVFENLAERERIALVSGEFEFWSQARGCRSPSRFRFLPRRTLMTEVSMPFSEKRIRIAIVDDHDLARAGLREVLADEPSVEVVGEASSGREAITLCARVRVDLALMDVRMPDIDGFATTRAIKRDHPDISVLMVSIYEETDYLFQALKAGAAGYVLKGASRDELVSAVLRVASGESPMDPALSTKLLKRLIDETQGRDAAPPEPARQPPAAAPPTEPLTPREREVLGLLAQGRTNREIARALVISAGTVKNHVEHIIAKMGVSDRTQAAVRAVELGLLADHQEEEGGEGRP